MTDGVSGFFVTLEGIEGVGKSTQVDFVCALLRDMDWPVIHTREPGGTEFGERIRTLLLEDSDQPMHADTELQLMFAARSEHLHKKIIPALKRGVAVVCDRFTDATYAYQGGGRGLDKERISILETLVQSDLRPDVTLLLDAPIGVALERSRSRAGAEDRFENEQKEFFERVRQVYLERARQMPSRYYIVNAQRSVKQVSTAIGEVITRILNERQTG